jgi:hypothetical protein
MKDFLRVSALICIRSRTELPLVVKETGTPVDFVTAKDVALNKFIFQDEVFGIYAYQGYPVTVDSATRNAFANGNLADLQNVVSANGMQLQYMRISWNEEVAGPNYYITDLVVGVVVKATSPIDISANRLLKALSYVNWYKNMILKLVMPWQVYVLDLPTGIAQNFNRWSWDAVSATFQLGSLSGTPSPPSVDEVRGHFITDGQVDSAMGKFVLQMLDQGYQVTLLGYQVSIGFETVRIWQYRDRSYAEYKTHTRLGVDFTSNPEIVMATEYQALIAPAVLAAIVLVIKYIIIAIAASAIAYFAIQALITQETVIEHIEEYYDADGKLVRRVIDRTTEKKPANWVGPVIAAVGILGVIIVAAVVLPRILPERKRQ